MIICTAGTLISVNQWLSADIITYQTGTNGCRQHDLIAHLKIFTTIFPFLFPQNPIVSGISVNHWKSLIVGSHHYIPDWCKRLPKAWFDSEQIEWIFDGSSHNFLYYLSDPKIRQKSKIPLLTGDLLINCIVFNFLNNPGTLMGLSDKYQAPKLSPGDFR